MSDRRTHQPEGVCKPAEPYSQAVSASGRLLFIAGQVSVNEQAETVGAGDMAAQVDQVFHNLGAVLESLGASFANVVKFTTFLARAEDLATFSSKRREIFSRIYADGDYPVNTMVVIDQLPNTDWLLEIEAIAAI